MAVEIATTPEFHAGTPKRLFEEDYLFAYDVHPDNQHLLISLCWNSARAEG